MQIDNLISAFVPYNHEHSSLAELYAVLHQRADPGIDLLPHVAYCLQLNLLRGYSEAMRFLQQQGDPAVCRQCTGMCRWYSRACGADVDTLESCFLCYESVTRRRLPQAEVFKATAVTLSPGQPSSCICLIVSAVCGGGSLWCHQMCYCYHIARRQILEQRTAYAVPFIRLSAVTSLAIGTECSCNEHHSHPCL